ncbi:MAG: YdcF family protein [Acidimicrobiales bacterium]
MARRQRTRGRVGRLAAVVVGGGIVYVLVCLAQVLWAAGLDQARPAQAIVVLGSAQYNGIPSPDLEARLSHVLALWRRGLSRHIVCSGGKEPGDHYTEAEAEADWLAARGVPRTSLLVVVQGRDTWQSLAAVAAVLQARGITTVLLVSDPFHDERIRLMSASLGLTPYVSPTRTSPIRGLALVPYYAKEALEVAVGRIIGFRRLSQITAR